MHWVVAISLGLLAYGYAGYPGLIWLLSVCRARPVERGPYAGGVSVLIAAHNEAGPLPGKVRNLLELARSEPIREIWIGLDGCTDRTGAAVREALAGAGGGDGSAGPKVEVMEFAERRGKASVLNALMAGAGEAVWVMMDARQRVEAGALTRLLENFADSRVGVVSGALVYETASGGVQKGAQSYWGYEKRIRRWESRYWAVPGATGALYAIRRELAGTIPEATLVDDVWLPMRAVRRGYRCLFEPEARVYDRPEEDAGREAVRKRRTLAGIWQLLRREPWMLLPGENPIWFQWMSHKVLRLGTPGFVVAAWGAAGAEAWGAPAGAPAGWASGVFWGLTALTVVSGLAYAWGRRARSRALGLLGAFFGVNLALVLAARDAWTGRFEPRWKKT